MGGSVFWIWEGALDFIFVGNQWTGLAPKEMCNKTTNRIQIVNWNNVCVPNVELHG